MTDSIYAWSTTPADNGAADATINFAENQAPSTVNNSARALMTRVKQLIQDIAPTRTSTGSSNAYAVTSSAAGATYRDGETVKFVPNHSNTGACTLNVNGRGAKSWRPKSGTSFAADNILAGVPVEAHYNLATDEWLSPGTGYYVTSLASGVALQSITARLPQIGDLVVSLAPSPGAGRIRLTEATQSILKTDWPELNSWLSARSYPWGSTATHFSLPPAAGYYLRFASTSASVDTSGARSAGSLQADQNKTATIPASGLTATTTNSATSASVPFAQGSTPFQNGGFPAPVVAGSTSISIPAQSASTVVGGSATLPGGDEVRVKNVAFHLEVVASTALAAAQVAVFGFPYQWDTGTTAANPGNGRVRGNNATRASITALYVSSVDVWGADISPLLSAIKSGDLLNWSAVGAQSNRFVVSATGASSAGSGFYAIPVSVTVSAPTGGNFTSNQNLAFELSPVGATGGGGAAATNLSYTASATNGIVVSDTGTDATLPLSDGTNAGLMAPAQHAKLLGIEAGATADQTGAEIVSAINATLGGTTWQAGGGGGGATNLTYTASPTNGIVASDTGTDATLPLVDGTNAGLMAPAQHTRLAALNYSALVDVVTQNSIDATGATDVLSALQSAINTVCSAGLVAYVKDGIYNLGSGTLAVPAFGFVWAGQNAILRRTSDPSTPAPCVKLLADATYRGGIVDNNVTASSTTSNSIGTGAKTFTVQTGLSYTAGAVLIIWTAANTWMQGTVTSYSGSTLVMNITTSNGSGTYTSWTVAYASAENAAVMVQNVSRAYVTDVRITSAGRKWAVGIEFDGASDGWAEDCTITGVHNRCAYVYRGCSSIQFEGVLADGGGICAYGFNVNPAASGSATQIKFVSCDAKNMAAQGFELGDNTFRSGFVGCTANTIANTGFLLQTANGGYPQYNFVSGCVASSCTVYGFCITDTFYNSLTSIEAVSCGTGVYFNGSSQLNSITGVRCDAGSTSGSQPGHGLRFSASASRNDVVGLAAIANAGTGVLFDAGSSLNRVLGRSFNNTTANVTDSGTSNTKDIITS